MDGRFPGLRVRALVSAFPVSRWLIGNRLAAYSCGHSRGVVMKRTAFPFHPLERAPSGVNPNARGESRQGEFWTPLASARSYKIARNVQDFPGPPPYSAGNKNKTTTEKIMKKSMSHPARAFLLAFFTLAGGISNVAAANPDFLNMDYIRAALQGNLQNMDETLAGKTESEADRNLYAHFHARFIDRTDGYDFEGVDPLVRKIGERYQDYWRDALLDPSARKALETGLYADLKTLLESEGITVTPEDMDDPDAFLTKVVEDRGYGALFGRTVPLLDFMLWRTTETKNQEVELTDGAYSFTVNYLKDFVSMGWSSFATFGGPAAGGWATKDGLYVVTPRWDLDSEAFKVSYFMHEGRHFADYDLYPNLGQPDLEYRAKLTELVYTKTDWLRLLMTFTAHAAKVDNSPHALANWYVVTNMSRALLGADWPESPDAWQSISVEDVNQAARKLLDKHSAILDGEGAKTTTGVILP